MEFFGVYPSGPNPTATWDDPNTGGWVAGLRNFCSNIVGASFETLVDTDQHEVNKPYDIRPEASVSLAISDPVHQAFISLPWYSSGALSFSPLNMEHELDGSIHFPPPIAWRWTRLAGTHTARASATYSHGAGFGPPDPHYYHASIKGVVVTVVYEGE